MVDVRQTGGTPVFPSADPTPLRSPASTPQLVDNVATSRSPRPLGASSGIAATTGSRGLSSQTSTRTRVWSDNTSTVNRLRA
jgi:hypothetical protein